MSIVIFTKNYAETLKQCLERFRLQNTEFKNSKITYAGRLDPLAEGLLILLTDEDVHKKESLLGLDKVYEVEFLLGLSTDSYDILGIPKEGSFNLKESDISAEVEALAGIKEQAYPPYSSKPVNGKPLYQWSKEGRLDEISIPVHAINVYEAHMIGELQEQRLGQLIPGFIETIEKIEGDFRQGAIKKAWINFGDPNSGKTLLVGKARFHVSSGAYIRGLVDSLGKILGCSACCIKIKRIKIGKYEKPS